MVAVVEVEVVVAVEEVVVEAVVVEEVEVAEVEEEVVVAISQSSCLLCNFNFNSTKAHVLLQHGYLVTVL